MDELFFFVVILRFPIKTEGHNVRFSDDVRSLVGSFEEEFNVRMRWREKGIIAAGRWSEEWSTEDKTLINVLPTNANISKDFHLRIMDYRDKDDHLQMVLQWSTSLYAKGLADQHLLDPIFSRPVFWMNTVSHVRFPWMIGSSHECK